MKWAAHLSAIAAFVAAAAYATAPNASRPVEIDAERIALNPRDAAQSRVGALAYRGGLVLRSRDRRFGGISGLRWLEPDGRLYAVTDQGNWLRIETRERAGRLTGIARASMGPLLDTGGRPLPNKLAADAEALTFDGRAALVAFERMHRVWRYAIDEEGALAGPAEAIPIAADWIDLQPANGGMEALTGGARSLVAISEDVRDDAGGAAYRQFDRQADGTVTSLEGGIPLPEPFKPTDADRLPDGGLLLLGRAFSPLAGVAAQVGIVTRGAGGTVHYRKLAELRPPLTVDNMEGIAVRDEAGRTMVYLISDDNFSALQRTLLLKFELVGAAGATLPAARSSAPF